MGSIFDLIFGKKGQEPKNIYTKEELLNLNQTELLMIVNSVQKRNTPNNSFHSFSSPQIHNALSFSYKLLGNSIGSSVEKNANIVNYESELKRLNLEVQAEEINLEEFELKSQILKSKLLSVVWNISNTPEEIVNKLFELRLITQKQKEICILNKDENNKLKDKNEKMLNNEYYYIDYILKYQ